MSTMPVDPFLRIRGVTVVRTAGGRGSAGATDGAGVGGASVGTAVGAGVGRAAVVGTGVGRVVAGVGAALGVGTGVASGAVEAWGVGARGLVAGVAAGATETAGEGSVDGVELCGVALVVTPWRGPTGGGADIRLQSQKPPPATATTPRAIGSRGGPLRSTEARRPERAVGAVVEREAGFAATRAPLGSPASRSCLTTWSR
jgi:hypothetical protein